MPPAQIEQTVQDSIQYSVQTNPEVVRPALIEGMTTLDNIETRVKAQSRNVSHEGIGIDSIHDMYMDYLQNKTTRADIAYPMADAIKTVMSTQNLTEKENASLTNALTGIIGDVNLAEAYVGRQAAIASSAAMAIRVVTAAMQQGLMSQGIGLSRLTMVTDRLTMAMLRKMC